MRLVPKPLRQRLDRYLRARMVEAVQSVPPPPVSDSAPRLHGTYAGHGRMLIAPIWGGRLHALSSDLSLTPELVAYGTYDVPLTAFVRRYIKPGDTVIDVGANIGLFTILLGYQVWEFGKVIAYEPSPRVLPVLRDNVAMNWFSDRVEVIPKAAAAEAGVVQFLQPGRFEVCGSIMPVEHLLVTDVRRAELERLEVESEPLDVHVGRFDRIDLIKIDAEGAEEQVFAGMERLLDSGTVQRVSFEIARSHMGDDWEPFADRLRRLRAGGWSFATLADSGDPQPVELEDLFRREQVSQVLMTRSG